ncbi:MAG TPA: hypothetical protein VMF52_20870 [Steroidobacteraceae bacterium]|nr:hypothetical protein [Steroidobacteraceae bacterium]
MKSSNLALRLEEDWEATELAELRELPEARAEEPGYGPRPGSPATSSRPRPRFDRRTIVIRDQGFRLFRMS